MTTTNQARTTTEAARPATRGQDATMLGFAAELLVGLFADGGARQHR